MDELFVSADHISIYCKDVETSVSFYKDTLGFVYDGRIEMEPPKSDLIYLNKGGTRLELSQRDISGLSTQSVFNHLGIRVQDIHEAYKALSQSDICAVVGEPIRGEYWFFFVEGPSGERIEFVQPL